MTSSVRPEPSSRAGTPAEVFRAFLKLGLTSFGGPIAHLGYFRDELVTRRRWLDDRAYGDLVALCQFLPGPASSQVGFGLGWLRAGPLGALAAWTAFTLPSAILMVLIALGAGAFEGPAAAGLLHGLKLVAVAVVAQAVFGMARSLAPDGVRAGIAVGAMLVTALWGGTLGQVGAITAGVLAGLVLAREDGPAESVAAAFPLSRRLGLAAMILFTALLVALPLLAGLGQGAALVDAFYRAGALVFGGGHVVLPLLEAETVGRGWVTPDGFIAGYGAAQAMPGPLFTFAAFLGAASAPEPNGWLGGALALIAIFLPGLLLLVGALPFWDRIRRSPLAGAGMRGANAAVVGILAAALYSPVFASAVGNPLDLALAAGGFVALVVWKLAPWVVVAALALCGTALGLLA